MLLNFVVHITPFNALGSARIATLTELSNAFEVFNIDMDIGSPD